LPFSKTALVARRKQLFAAADGAWPVAAVFVLSFADEATGTTHQRSVVRFLSQLLDDLSMTFDEILNLIGDTGSADADQLLRARFPDIPADLLGERVAVATNNFLRAAALRAARERRDQLVDDDVFRRNLVDTSWAPLPLPFSKRRAFRCNGARRRMGECRASEARPRVWPWRWPRRSCVASVCRPSAC